MKKIFVLGSINMDVVIRVDRNPKPGETMYGNDAQFIPGGKGANQALAAHRLGAEVKMYAKVGNDAFGNDLKAFFQSQKMDVSDITFAKSRPTGTAFVLVDKEGRNTITAAAGSNGALASSDIARVQMHLGDIALSTLETPQATTITFFQKAKKAGAMTMLNAAPALAISRKLFSLIDILVVNEVELALYAKKKVNVKSMSDMVRALGRLELRSDQTVIATLGSEGLICAGGGATIKVPGQKVKVVDTTGAGDCFVGAFATGMAEGMSRGEALTFANAAAALSVTKLGASASMPKKTELAAFMKNHGRN